MSNFWNCSVDDKSMPAINLRDLDVRQHEGEHDTAVVSLRNVVSSGLAYQNGKSVHVTWGSAANRPGEFFGYVDHVVPDHSIDLQPFPGTVNVQLMCVGVTLPFQNGTHRSWVNRSSDSIASEVISQHRLSPLVDRHPFVWPHTVQSGESDWQFLVKQARRVGYSLIPLGSTVRFQDPAQVISRGSPVAYYTTREVRAVSPSIDSFSPRLGNPSEFDYAERTAFGVDPRGGVVKYSSVFSGSTKPATGLDRLSRPRALQMSSPDATSFVGAQAVVDGMAKANWAVTADLVGAGDGLVRPGALVSLIGVGKEYSGNWYVLGARHVFKRTDMYRVQLELVRDAVRPSPSAGFKLPEFIHIGGAAKAPKTVRLPNGKWAAAWRTQ